VRCGGVGYVNKAWCTNMVREHSSGLLKACAPQRCGDVFRTVVRKWNRLERITLETPCIEMMSSYGLPGSGGSDIMEALRFGVRNQKYVELCEIY